MPGFVFAQARPQVRGEVVDERGEGVPFASVRVVAGTAGTVADVAGAFTLQLAPGAYRLEISSLGFRTLTEPVRVSAAGPNVYRFTLSAAVRTTDVVTVRAKSREQERRELPLKVEVIDVEAVRAQSIPVATLMNQTAGVNIRQAGGVGSETTINVNGLQGRAIRFFRDGILVDYLGRAFTPNLLPVDQLENVEIFKGALPAALGADALGGAVNLISRVERDNNLSLSYGYGSFGTHRANVNGYYQAEDSPWFVSGNAYGLRSDNDYDQLVPLTDPVTQNRNLTELPRFHDGVSSAFAEIKTGVKDTKWADLLEVSLAAFDYECELQNNLLLTAPYGEARAGEGNLVTALRYRKSWQRFRVDVFGARGERRNTLTDTTDNRYDWRGEIIRSTPNAGGEISSDFKTLQRIDWTTHTGRAYLTYQLGERQRLYLSHTFVGEGRTGSNPPGPRTTFSNIDPLGVPASYRRHVTGLGWGGSWWKGRLSHELTAKHYALNTRSLQTDFVLAEEVPRRVTDGSFGAGNSLKYQLGERHFVRLSYEYATRLPDAEEYLGDGLFVVGNPDLRPERSHNVNLGWAGKLDGRGRYGLDVNTFYRYVEDNLFLLSTLFISRYVNLDDRRVLGAEATLRGELAEGLDLTAALTYQDLRRVNTPVNIGGLEGSRIPNVHYFYANLGLRYARGAWMAYGNYNFVEQYLLGALPPGREPALFGAAGIGEDLLIPRQHLVNIGLTFSPEKLPLTLNIEIQNLLNADVFDRFRVQRPGRGLYAKATYRIQ